MTLSTRDVAIGKTNDLVLVERVYECVDVEENSEDTDFSGEEDNPGKADTHTQILSEAIHPQDPIEIKDEPLEEIAYNNSKYFKKKRSVISPTIINTETSEPYSANEPRSTEETQSARRHLETSEEETHRSEPSEPVHGVPCIQIKDEPVENLEKATQVKKEESFEFGVQEQKLLKTYDLIRSWRETGLGRELSSGTRAIFGDHTQFRILTYNILAQSVLDRKEHLFKGKCPSLLRWEYRLAGLKRELETVNPDIVCLQEVEFKDHTTVADDVAQFLSSRGFLYIGKRRTGGNVDGCAIFYRSALFECEDSRRIELKRSDLKVLSGNSVGVMCRLKSKKIAQRLVVGTLHLLHGQNKQVNRLAQLAVFIADMHEICEVRQGRVPCLLAGDFNTEPYTDTHTLLIKGKLRYAGLKCGTSETYPRSIFPPGFGLSDDLYWIRDEKCTQGSGSLRHDLGFRSVYQYRQERDLYKGYAPPENEVSAYQGKWVSVDHILYSTHPSNWENQSFDGRVEKHLKLLGKWSLPTSSGICGLGGLPSSISPSDHLPLAADFLLMVRP